MRAQAAGASWCRGLRGAAAGIDSVEGGVMVASSREALKVRGGSGEGERNCFTFHSISTCENITRALISGVKQVV